MVTAIILAGGVGSRVGADRPKQFVKVLDKPILAYTIEIFEFHPEVDAIEVVCHKSWKEYLDNIIEKYGYKKVKWIAVGGETFQDSVMSGVENLRDKISKDDYILIQYGAAPFTSDKIVTEVIRVMKEKGTAVTATPCYQLMGSRDGEVSKNWVDRDRYIQIASPYGFKYEYLLGVYERAKEQGLIERIDPHTTSLMYALGDKLNLAYGDQTNIKITTKEDIDMFEGYVLQKRRLLYKIHTGTFATEVLMNIVDLRIHKKENSDKWNKLNAGVELSLHEKQLKMMIMEFFDADNKERLYKLYYQIMGELDIQDWY